MEDASLFTPQDYPTMPAQPTLGAEYPSDVDEDTLQLLMDTEEGGTPELLLHAPLLDLEQDRTTMVSMPTTVGVKLQVPTLTHKDATATKPACAQLEPFQASAPQNTTDPAVVKSEDVPPARPPAAVTGSDAVAETTAAAAPPPTTSRRVNAFHIPWMDSKPVPAVPKVKSYDSVGPALASLGLPPMPAMIPTPDQQVSAAPHMSTPASASKPQVRKRGSAADLNAETQERPQTTSSSPPEDMKKQKRLIRNRLSAALHRERKKAYIDKLENEVRQRDETISKLQQRVHDLNVSVKALSGALKRHGIPVDPYITDGFTTWDSSDASETDGSDGTITPPPPGVGHASTPPPAQNVNAPASCSSSSCGEDADLVDRPSKIPRLASRSVLAAVVCLVCFRLPMLYQWMGASHSLAAFPRSEPRSTPAAAPASWQSTTSVSGGIEPHATGRVLMAMTDDLAPTDDHPSEPSATHGPLTASTDGRTDQIGHQLAVRSRQPSLAPLSSARTTREAENSSYFVCPHLLGTSDIHHGSLSFPDRPLSAAGSPANVTRFSRSRGRQLRHRHKGRAAHLSDAESKSVVPSSELVRHSSIRPASDMVLSSAISKFLLDSQKTNETDSRDSEGALVPFDASMSRALQAVRSQSGEFESAPDSVKEPPFLLLLVPSSTIYRQDMSGYDSDSAGWVEVGCQLQSARFVGGVDFSRS